MSTIPQVYAAASTLGVPQPAGIKITDLGKFVSVAITYAFYIAFILAFVFLVMGGIEWLTSGGDKGKTESARNRITAALVGLAIVAASWALMQILATVFGIDILGGNMTLPTPF